MALAERYFRETAATDLEDTTAGIAGGVRIAALGGLWQAAVLGFAGMALLDDGLSFAPRMPATWSALSFGVQWRGRHVEVSLDGATRRLSATLAKGTSLRSASAPRRTCSNQVRRGRRAGASRRDQRAQLRCLTRATRRLQWQIHGEGGPAW